MEEKHEWWIDEEINPARMNETIDNALLHPEQFEEEHPKAEVMRTGAKAKYFAIFFELMRKIANCIEWNKKARIVVEYDPRQRMFSVAVVKERGEQGTNGVVG